MFNTLTNELKSQDSAPNPCQTFVPTIHKNIKKMEKLMKPNEHPAETASHTFLTGAILFANLDYSGLTAYAVKAAIGGAIWMVFKLAGDFISYKLLSNKKKDEDENSFDGKED